VPYRVLHLLAMAFLLPGGAERLAWNSVAVLQTSSNAAKRKWLAECFLPTAEVCRRRAFHPDVPAMLSLAR